MLFRTCAIENYLLKLQNKSKLRRFYFNVVYQPGSTTTDNGSCHPHLLHLYTAREGIELHIEDKEKETEIIVNWADKVIDFFSIDILLHIHLNNIKALSPGMNILRVPGKNIKRNSQLKN